MRVAGFLSLVLLAAVPAGGHGSTTPPPEPEPPPPRERPPPPPEHPQPPPTWDPAEPPITPRDDQPEDPLPPQPEPMPPKRAPVRDPVRTGRRTGASEDAWRYWWEYNREYLLGLRKMMRERVVVTGDGRVDPLGERRAEVLATLRGMAESEGERTVRASALIALGRMGGDQDARRFVDTIARETEPIEIREAAVVGLAILPPFADKTVAERVRSYLLQVLRRPEVLTGRARGLVLCAIGIRARGDAALRMELVARVAAGGIDDAEEAANLAFACGLAGDSAAVPELLRAVRKGEFAGANLTDIGRAHAVTAYGRAGGIAAIDDLCTILRSRRSGVDTKRSAALALGRTLREAEVEEAAAERAGRALRECFEGENDTVLRGFAAVALGGARPPRSLPVLMEAIDHGGNAAVKPYCALALGLGARTLGGDEAKRIGTFLKGEQDKAAHLELGTAVSLALGLAKTADAEAMLLERVSFERLPAPARGAAAQAIGLMGTATPAAIDALNAVARSGTAGVLENAALALGLLGRRSVAKELAAGLPRLGSAQAQARVMLALSYLAHTESVEPLLTVLKDKAGSPPTAREFAAVALGIIGDPRDDDPMFELDAWFNVHATTRATNELVRLY